VWNIGGTHGFVASDDAVTVQDGPGRPPKPAERPPTPAWAQGTGLTADGPLAALVAEARWCCWVWHPVYRKRDGVWVWTKRPVGAPKDSRQPWPLAVNKVEEQGRSYALAQAAVLAGKADGVGWLMLEELKLVWLDLDKCRDPETGAIDAWALAVMARAGDAYTEVTPSGSGVRLCGRASELDVPLQGVWKPPGGEAEGARPGAQVEVFYGVARFVTVTGQALGGSLEVELGGLAFELRQAGLAQERGGGGGGRGVPGDKQAPIEDVVSALEVIGNDAVDWNEWSRVGMAAWAATRGSWEGLEAWMGWSMRCEDKHDPGACTERWEHWGRSPPTELGIGALVLLAQAASGGRWRRPSRRPAAEFDAEQDAGGNGEGEEEEDDGGGSGFARLARGLVYVEELHRYLDVGDKALLDDARVRARAARLGCAGAYATGAKSIIAQLHGHPAGLLRRVKGLTMRPGQGLLLTENGRPCANLWRPSRLVPSEADAGPWLRHMGRLIPDEAERALTFDVMAFGLQRPGVKINWGLVLLGGQGTGKDTGLLPFLAAVGQHNVATVQGVAIGGQFNGYLRKPWLLISEMPPANKRSCYEEIKSWLTTPPDDVAINMKGLEMFSVPNIVNVVVTTNHAGAIALAEDDRRFVVVATVAADQGEDKVAYYGPLYRWLETGGLEAAAGWLLRRDVAAFTPKIVPLPTAGTVVMMREGAPPGVAWACGLWEADGGGLFEQRELLTVIEVMECASHVGNGAGEPVRKSLTDKQVAMALRLSGWRLIRTRVPDGLTRPYPWTRSGSFELLSQLNPKSLQERLEEDRRLRTGGGGGGDWAR